MGRDFDGVDDVMVTNSYALNGVNTLFTWINPQSHGSGNDQDIVMRNGEANTQNMVFEFVGSDSPTRTFEVRFDQGGGGTLQDPSPNVFVANEWHCASSTMANPNGELFVDGLTVDTNLNSWTPDAEVVNMGGRSGSNDAFDGTLAEFVIWDVVLSDEEELALFHGVCPFAIRPSNFTQYHPTWGNQSPEHDLSNNGHNATVTGAVKAIHPPVELIENYL